MTELSENLDPNSDNAIVVVGDGKIEKRHCWSCFCSIFEISFSVEAMLSLRNPLEETIIESETN